MKKPLIGITTDIEDPGKDKWAKYAPWYALRDSYCNAVAKHGAMPLLLPHQMDMIEDYLDLIDGVMTTGGDFDIDPALYGETEIHPTVSVKKGRTEFEFAIVEGALKRDMPILGICGGEQLLNVVLGGTLIQHVPDAVDSDIAHEQSKRGIPSTTASHSITIVEGTKLNRIMGTTDLEVNSTHHQAVKDPAAGVIVSATAPDGIIEAIEYPDHKFCIGVQWHPEYEISSEETALFKSFVEACK